MLQIQQLRHCHPDGELLFDRVSMALETGEKASIVGNNGVGKSTLLRMIAGELQPTSGTILTSSKPYLVPQHYGQYDYLTIAQALGVETKLTSLRSILAGTVTDAHIDTLDDDWDVEERCMESLSTWGLFDVDLFQPLSTLSGGEKTRVFLAGLSVVPRDLVLMDEPSNHLDADGRESLYEFIRRFKGSMVVVSHDRKLLNHIDSTHELSRLGIASYGGNYDFYRQQKGIQLAALSEEVAAKERSLIKAKATARDTLDRQLKLNARGKKKQQKSGMPKIVMNTMRNKAENSTARILGTHTNRLESLAKDLQEIKTKLPIQDAMKLALADPEVHKRKLLFESQRIQYSFDDHQVWGEPVDLYVNSGDRIAIKGRNGSGKSTLLQVVLGNLSPTEGNVYRADVTSVHIDQDYSLIQNHLSVYGQAMSFASVGIADHEVRTRLHRFLFAELDWVKPCAALSGGERMRLLLCCISLMDQAPDLIVLDEPTNNLDIQNIEMLTRSLRTFKGAILAVSHDETFLDDIGIERIYELK